MVTRRTFIGGIGAFGGWRLFAAAPGACLGDEPNLRFGVLSDLHIRCVVGDRGYDGDAEGFRHALEYFRDRKVDAVMIAGDMSDLGIGDELMSVARTWYGVFPNDRAPDGRTVEKIFITGNHESGTFVNPRNLAAIRRIFAGDDREVRRQILRSDFATWWERAFNEPYSRFYHKRVKGYDFLSAHWDDGTALTPETPLEGLTWSFLGEDFGVPLKAWLEKHGKDLDPKKPFFYQQHRALWKSNFADWAWNHDRGVSTEVLSRYPNAVSFAGDTHYTLTDERSVWQGAFTSLGTASLRYTGMPYDSRDLASFENSSARGRHAGTYNPLKTMSEYDPFMNRQGMVVSVYDDRMVVERRDFANDVPLGDDWVMPLDGSKPYGFETRAKRAKAPEFPADARLLVRCVKAKTRGGKGVPKTEKDAVEIVIPPVAGMSGSRCFEFVVTAFGKDGKTAEFHVLAEGFDRHPGHARTKRPTHFTVALDRLPAGTDRFVVAPLDCWWNRGAELSCAGWRPHESQGRASSPSVTAN